MIFSSKHVWFRGELHIHFWACDTEQEGLSVSPIMVALVWGNYNPKPDNLILNLRSPFSNFPSTIPETPQKLAIWPVSSLQKNISYIDFMFLNGNITTHAAGLVSVNFSSVCPKNNEQGPTYTGMTRGLTKVILPEQGINQPRGVACFLF